MAHPHVRSLVSDRAPLGLAAVCLVAVLASQSCGGKSPAPPSNNSTATSSSRIAWDQQAADASDLPSLHFVLYVDGTRTELPAASCSTPAAPAGFPCLSPLPSMSAGPHTLQLAAYVLLDGQMFESDKSAPLVINFSSALTSGASGSSVVRLAPAGAATARAEPRSRAAAADARVSISVIAPLAQVNAIALTPDGSIFVGDDAGRVRLVQRNTASSAATLAITEALAAGDGGGVLDLALDPRFSMNHFVYIVDTVSGDPPRFRLSRYREVSGRLGERAVLLASTPSAPEHPAASVSFGPDGKLYLALDDGGDPEGAARAASYNGAVLRLDPDGTTPRDRSATPVYARGFTSPRSAGWDDESGALWVADSGQARVSRVRQGAEGTLARTTYEVSATGGPASVAVYRGMLMPWSGGSLLVAPTADGDFLLRIPITGSGDLDIRASERLTLAGASRVRAVKVGPDGAIYVATDLDVRRIAAR